MGRSAASFKRPQSRFKPHPTVLIICEDSKSGKRYLEDASRYFRVDVKVEIAHCGHTDPQGIVAEALKRQVKFDKVYCVFDRDKHDKFNEALDLAKTSQNVFVIASYPCYEFWLLLHFKDTSKPYTAVGQNSAADLVIKDLRACPGMETYDKTASTSIFDLLLNDNKFIDARRRAAIILSNARVINEWNPSTRIHELLDFFEKLSVPQPK